VRVLRHLCVPLVLIAACTKHEPEIDRVGGPIPDAGSSCNLEPDPAAQFPCEVDLILETRCRRCHGSPTKNGAPFPLLTWNDTLKDYSGPIYEAMYKAVKLDFMPYCADGSCSEKVVSSLEGGPTLPLSAEQKKTLLDYLVCPEPEYGLTCSPADGGP
jgi:hypothetical protein